MEQEIKVTDADKEAKKDSVREILVYLVVGVMTTIFCFVVMWILSHVVFDPEDVANSGLLNGFIQTADWLAGVLFAYPLNRKWVFKSTNPHVIKELTGFAGSRVSTWLLDMGIMLLFVNIFPLDNFVKWLLELFGQTVTATGEVIVDFMFIHMETNIAEANLWFVKIFISSVLVMIANYIFSKLLIFKKKPAETEKSE
ncbi:MAG: GtrA family protein [Lachnospiraceae bacterium]|nr:GtrA family protein [Lachnospiraceae bacterium]